MPLADLINIALTIIGGVFGWVLKLLWSKFKELDESDQSINKEIYDIKISLAKSYVTYSTLEKKLDTIFSALEKISDKIDKKADK